MYALLPVAAEADAVAIAPLRPQTITVTVPRRPVRQASTRATY